MGMKTIKTNNERIGISQNPKYKTKGLKQYTKAKTINTKCARPK
jgi:hypothetical protein